MRQKEPSTCVIFVRHGKTDYPSKRIYCDDVEDPRLNEEGVSQARSAAEMLAVSRVDAIYSSPSSRTMMTAQEIARAQNTSIHEVADLRERRFGAWDGMYFDEIEAKYPEEYALWKQDPVRYTPSGGETIEHLEARVTRVLEEIVKNHMGKKIIVVSHVGPIRVGLTKALGIPIDNYRQLTIDHASLTRVDFGVSQNNLLYANLTKDNFI